MSEETTRLTMWLEEVERKKERCNWSQSLRYMQMCMVQSELNMKKGSETGVSDLSSKFGT